MKRKVHYLCPWYNVRMYESVRKRFWPVNDPSRPNVWGEGDTASWFSLYSPWQSEREGEDIRAPSPESVPCMPWLVGNRVTCHRSRRINKLARSDEFGSIPRLVCCLSPKGSRGTNRITCTLFSLKIGQKRRGWLIDNEGFFWFSKFQLEFKNYTNWCPNIVISKYNNI